MINFDQEQSNYVTSAEYEIKNQQSEQATNEVSNDDSRSALVAPNSDVSNGSTSCNHKNILCFHNLQSCFNKWIVQYLSILVFLSVKTAQGDDAGQNDENDYYNRNIQFTKAHFQVQNASL